MRLQRPLVGRQCDLFARSLRAAAAALSYELKPPVQAIKYKTANSNLLRRLLKKMLFFGFLLPSSCFLFYDDSRAAR